MTRHPVPFPAPPGPPWGQAATLQERPATVRAPVVILVVLAALAGLLAALVLAGVVAGAVTGDGAPGGDPARAAGRLVGGALVVGLPLAAAALHAWMALAVRARRTWPVGVVTVLAALGGALVLVVVLSQVWTVVQSGDAEVPLLLGVVLLAPLVLVVSLQVGAAVLLRRPAARAWASGGARP